MLVVFQEEQSDGSIKHDYLLGRGLLGVPLAEAARVLEARHRIEECLERAKGEAGLGDYQVRTWQGWHHHMALALLAAWFLTGQTRREKNPDAGDDGAGAGADAAAGAGRAAGAWVAGERGMDDGAVAGAERGGAVLPLEEAQPVAA